MAVRAIAQRKGSLRAADHSTPTGGVDRPIEISNSRSKAPMQRDHKDRSVTLKFERRRYPVFLKTNILPKAGPGNLTHRNQKLLKRCTSKRRGRHGMTVKISVNCPAFLLTNFAP